MKLGMRAEKRVSKVVLWVLLAIVLAIVLFPIYWMMLTAIKPDKELYLAVPTLWTPNPTLDHLWKLFKITPYALQARNSLFVAGMTTSLAIVVSVLAGYSLSRLHYRGRDVMAASIFFVYLIPGTLTLIPLYVFMNQLKLLNSLTVLVVASLAFTIPFCTWMLKGYFTTIPMELEDAALIDGCNRLQALYHVILPLAAPGIVASGIFAFTLSWNEFLLPLLFNSKKQLWTLPVGIQSMMYGDVFMWGEIMIGAFLMSIPVLVLYMVSQRYVVTGLTAGAVKG
jgi:multiple sugar transport system permease protein